MKTRVLVVGASLAASAAGLWLCSLTNRITHLETVGTPVSNQKTMFGATQTGCGQQSVGSNTRLICSAFDETLVPPATNVFLGCLDPAPANGSHWDITEVVSLDYSGTGVNCDAGNCIADIRTYYPGTLQGGGFCRGDGTCMSAAIDNYQGLGPMSGVTAPLVFTDAGTVCADVYCALGCWARGTLSALGGSTPHDAGAPVDAGPPADAGHDSGPPCTISSIAPPIGPATAQHTPVTITGTVLAGSTFTIAGSTCTVISTSATTNVCTPTDYSGGSNGSPSGIAQAFTGTTAGGNTCVTPNNADGGIDKQLGFFYLPSNTPLATAHFANTQVTIATGVSNLGDFSVTDGGGAPLAQAVGGFQAPQTAGFNGTSLPYLAFNGSTYMSNTIAANPSGLLSAFLIGEYASVSGGVQTAWTLYDNGGSGSYQYLPVRALSGNWQATDSLVAANYSGTADTAAHVWGMIVGAGGASSLYLDNTLVSTSFTPASLSGLSLMSCDYAVGDPVFCAPLEYVGDLVYSAAVSPADAVRIQADLNAVETP